MIKREIKREIIEHFQQKEISVIAGARQVGKTTLMDEIRNDLVLNGERVIYFNVDLDSDARFFESQSVLLKKVQLEIGDEGYVFIDEVQRLTNAGLFLKGLYDRGLKYKFVVTGSGSLELKEKIHESLAGRKRLFEMESVSFKEFVDYKTNYKYSDKLPLFFELEHEQTHNLLLEYLNYGGYPRIVTETTKAQKLELIAEIFSSYISKDLVHLLNIDRPDMFQLLIRVLAANAGGITNYSELSKSTGISVATVKRYLWYAEKTFCVNYVSPYYTNPLKEITKSPTYYFSDIGFRNYAIGAMGNLVLPNQIGFVFQSFVFNLLKQYVRKHHGRINYWRTKDKAEVDFVVDYGSQILPVEVKYGNIKKMTVSRSFRSFLGKYMPCEAWIITVSYQGSIVVGTSKVRFIPFYKLYDENFH